MPETAKLGVSCEQLNEKVSRDTKIVQHLKIAGLLVFWWFIAIYY